MTEEAQPIGPVDVVVNPKAGRGAVAGAVEIIDESAKRRGLELSIHSPVSVVEADRELAAIVANGANRLIVVGGDGAVHQAVQHVAETGCVLGIVPAGTGNDFAAALGLPTDIEAAFGAALGHARNVDAVRVGSKWAATVVTLGFSVAVNERAETMAFPRGPSRYTVATVRELPRLKANNLEITVDGKELDVLASIVAIANTTMFGGGMKIAPDADHNDGLLDVVIISDVKRLTLLRMLRAVVIGTHVDHQAVTVVRGHEVQVRGDHARVRADGELLCEVPFDAVAVKDALLIAGA